MNGFVWHVVGWLILFPLCLGLLRGAGRLFRQMAPPQSGVERQASVIRPRPALFGAGVLILLFGLPFLALALAGLSHGNWILLPLAALVPVTGALIIHFTLTVRLHILEDRLICDRWLRPTLEAPMSDIEGAELTTGTKVYRVRLVDGRRIERHASVADIHLLHDALKKAGKPTPDDEALKRAIAFFQRWPYR